VKSADFFTLPPSLARFAAFFPPDIPPWDWVKRIGDALASVDGPVFAGPVPPGFAVSGRVWIDPSVALPSYGTVVGPAWIGAGVKLLPGCYLRGNVIIGAGSIVGHDSEVKNSLLLEKVQAPHRPYVGDSVLGNGAHLGAGVVLSNLRLDQRNVTIRVPDSPPVDTGMRKLGAILGDAAEIGCNTVLNPGTILGPRAVVGPGAVFGGVLPADTFAVVRQSFTTSVRIE
jgi:UDP-N-acetylglucosamine diphosphorylase / glucose-1-phosphate thymidylyltransferase / UDP-N-acetylgalactosamine diphosphorylase / glucosamine-1-phosphate N-acetyltransferase / galactosamine-1-phosphate N-acetyltransferase